MRTFIESVNRRAYAVFPTLHYYGGSLWLAWALLIYSGELFAGNAEIHFYNTYCFAISTTVFGLVFVAFAFVSSLPELLKCRRFVLGVSCLASVGTLLVMLAPLWDSGWWFLSLLGNICTGFGTACYAMRAAIQFGNMSPRKIFAYTAVTLFVALIWYEATLAIDTLVAQTITVLLPVAASVLSFIDYGPDQHTYMAGAREVPPYFLRFALVVFAISLMLTTIRGFYPNALQLESFNQSREFVAVVLGIFCLCIALTALALRKHTSFISLGYAAFLVCLIVVLFASVFGFRIVSAGVMFSIAAGVLGNVVWASLGTISSQTGLVAVRAYGIGFASYMFGSSLGWLLGSIIDSLGLENVHLLFSLAALAMVGVVPLVVLRSGDVEKLSQVMSFDDDSFDEEVPGEASPVDIAEDNGDQTFTTTFSLPEADTSQAADLSDASAPSNEEETVHPSRWRLHMMELATDYKLTERETEVFVLMGKGKNARVISEELFVSYNTARTHVRNIYTKLGVGSRTEFTALIEGKHAEK